jgi:hypothetical protein
MSGAEPGGATPVGRVAAFVPIGGLDGVPTQPRSRS